MRARGSCEQRAPIQKQFMHPGNQSASCTAMLHTHGQPNGEHLHAQNLAQGSLAPWCEPGSCGKTTNRTLRRAPTAPCIPPPTPRPGGFGGSQRSNGSPHGSPYTGGEMNLPPRMGGVSTLPISLITLFFHDINPV